MSLPATVNAVLALAGDLLQALILSFPEDTATVIPCGGSEYLIWEDVSDT